MPDLLLLLLCVPIFLLSGLVKGTVGMGQPATAIGLLTFFVPLDEAVVIVLVPGLITNAIQTFKGPPVWGMLRRLRIFFVMNVVFAWIGVKILATGEIMALTAVLGVLLILHAGGMWVTNWRVISRRAERILQVPVGSLNGLFVGMTGATPFPGVPYLQSLGMEREELILSLIHI
ncbi:MAG: sulfite exporter TauE/SafE family protein, partial [Alphaproteobacteria bacterium]|nr:sulfite exporter TauE/SafE family protein [Alphaproteobacteria bacterium]